MRCRVCMCCRQFCLVISKTSYYFVITLNADYYYSLALTFPNAVYEATRILTMTWKLQSASKVLFCH